MIELFRILWEETKDIYQKLGITGLIKVSFRCIISPVYKRESFYLYEYYIKPDYNENQIILDLNTNDLCFKVVTSNHEADKLEDEGFTFRSYPTVFNLRHRNYNKWLNHGAIACCTFNKKELAAINWVILSVQVQDKLTFPLEVDYTNHEFFSRGSWTNPKYRHRHIYQYTAINRDRYLAGIGISKLRTTIGYTNQVGKYLVESLGGRQYGRAIHTRILFWKLWRENRTH